MKKPKIKRLELDMAELEAILEHTRSGPLSDEEHSQLKAVLTTLGYLTQELEKKRTSITRLRHLLFGAKTEKTDEVLKQNHQNKDDSSAADPSGKNKKKKNPRATGAKLPRPAIAPYPHPCGQWCGCLQRRQKG